VLVDKPEFLERLRSGAAALGVQVPREAEEGLLWLASELRRWNAKVNLTAIVDPIAVLDKHILDSLGAVIALAPDARVVLDVGTGAGFPGLPLALVRPELEFWLVDAAAKKVGFVKHAVAHLGLAPRVRALHVNLQGARLREGLPEVDAAVSRAFRDVAGWGELAQAYVRTGGQLVAMAGGVFEPPLLQGWSAPEAHPYGLPNGDGRTVVAYRKLA
jgi:16S rRNA (guanine527-N7)-methyltransferase